MLGPADYLLWMCGPLLDVWVVVCAVRSRSLFRYFTLNLYMLVALMLSAGRYVVFSHYGLTSPQYYHFYYFSDALLTICLYFVLMGLYSLVFEEMGVSRYLRVGAILLLGLTVAFSYQMVVSSSHKLLTRFVLELSQNLYFVGLVLTYLLWGAIMKLRETRTRLIQLVLALGVYFSAFAANYAMQNIYPGLSAALQYVPPLLALWLPLAWGYTFWKVPEEARLATERVATAPHR